MEHRIRGHLSYHRCSISLESHAVSGVAPDPGCCRACPCWPTQTLRSSLNTLPHHLSYIVAAARIADALAQDVLLPPLKRLSFHYPTRSVLCNRRFLATACAISWSM